MKRTFLFCLTKDNSPCLNKGILNLVMFFILIVLICGVSGHTAYAQSNTGNAASNVKVAAGDEWKYYKGTQSPPRYWKDTGFDDSSWLSGQTALGYGNSYIKTHLGDMHGNYSTVYARINFAINDIYTVTGMTLSVVCDGPFIAYLNGVEVIRNSSSMTDQSSATPQAEALNISGFIHELFPRNNVLSIECNNDDIKSNDFSLLPVFEVLEDQGGSVQ